MQHSFNPRLSKFLYLILLAGLPLAAEANDFQRQQKLRESATAWAQNIALPALTRHHHISSISSFGVMVEEPRVLLPPDLGGPDPRNPVTTVKVKVQFSGRKNDHWSRPVYSSPFVNCRFEQTLLAEKDKSGRPLKIRPGQPFHAVLACANTGSGPWPPRPGYWP